jgi:predicted CoA-binding protein
MVEKHGTSVVLGASPNPSRASHMAVQRLSDRGMPVRAIGIRDGEIRGVKIETDRPEITEVETLTLYIGQKNMVDWEEYALNLKPRRIIFNPGTENPGFEADARSAGIHIEHACTLVMLSNNSY